MGVVRTWLDSEDRRELVAAVAAAQEGCIQTSQLEAVGFRRSTISSQVATGRLHLLHRGVYRVGFIDSNDRTLKMSALLTAKTGTLLGSSALEVWGAIPESSTAVRIHQPGRPHQSHRGIHAHGGNPIPAEDLGAIDRLRVTLPARSLLDYAEHSSPTELERALDELRGEGLLGKTDLADLKRRTPGRRGWRPLGLILAADSDQGFSRKEAERLLAGILREAELHGYERNASVAGWSLDFYWPRHRLAVEFDSWTWHENRGAFENDRRKTTELDEAGITVLRFTWRQITERQLWVTARIGSALGRRGISRRDHEKAAAEAAA